MPNQQRHQLRSLVLDSNEPSRTGATYRRIANRITGKNRSRRREQAARRKLDAGLREFV